MDDRATASIFDLFGDVRAKIAALARAEMRVLSAEMQLKVSVSANSFAWIAVGALLLLSAFAFALTALLLLMISLGIEAHVSAAILAVLLACLGLLAALKGRAQLRGGSLLPDLTLARLRRDADVFKGSTRDA